MVVGQGVAIFGWARWWGSRGDLARGEAKKEKPSGDLARGAPYCLSSQILVIGSDKEYEFPFLVKIPASDRAFAADWTALADLRLCRLMKVPEVMPVAVFSALTA